ncbi:DDHD domain-containing protein [Delphinella strobiligena]|nr:DDHD domain-containing protein [Delphinella strobiligena]
MSNQDNQSQSYLAKLTPWGGRSSPAPRPAPNPNPNPGSDAESASGDLGLKQTKGSDHRVSHRHRLSSRSYPRDCPPLLPQWFFATDVPKRRPSPLEQSSTEPEKPRLAPKKYAPFSKTDSKAIEAAFQRLACEEDAAERDDGNSPKHSEGKTNSSLKADENRLEPGSVTVPVNEDYLFDVDVERRELAPAYWLGPVYEVRRGTWFYQDSSSVQRPCDENLAAQLEEGYLKLCPWREVEGQEGKQERTEKEPTASQPRPRPLSQIMTTDTASILRAAASSPVSPRASSPNLRDQTTKSLADGKAEAAQAIHQARTLRLFGPHSNSVVTYQDGITAWILTDDFISRMSSNMYKRFAGGGHYAGIKVTRGYIDQTKRPEEKDGKTDQTAGRTSDKNSPDASGRNADENLNVDPAAQEGGKSPSETRRETLERQMSSLVGSVTKGDREKEEEEIRKRDEKEIQDDYRDQEGEDQNREIEHLLLVTHGIGQRLGLRMESVNFVHDVNTFRKTLKAVYNESPDLQALNSEVDKLPKNCRIQVLPINWRHKLDFPKQSLKHNRREHDLGDAGFGEEEDYPNLDDISVEGVPAVRNLITDLALDILLYQSPAYKDHISRIVLEECNRMYNLFKERNPSFNGKVSMVGHSLGSAVMFDILCMQDKLGHKDRGRSKSTRKREHGMKLDFEVEDFYALGSPVGLFQMLKGRTIAAREAPPARQKSARQTSDPFLDSDLLASSSKLNETMGTSDSEIPTSSPKCRQLFNIFHPTDPISYRIEPLISPAMASLKPQPLPYTKRGIFGSQVGQGLTGIGARVGQSVSGMWSSFSSGIASSLLNRTLGFTAEDASKLGGPSGSTQSRAPLSLGAGTNVAAGTIPTAPLAVNIDRIDAGGVQGPARDEPRPGEPGQHPPTLIDSELQTLFAGFQSRRKSVQTEDTRGFEQSPEDAEAEERGRRLRKEEAKVRALNLNGRVDYSIQEGAFDISLIAAVASHLSYWADEDVSHFMISQLLSRQRVVRKSRSAPALRGP